METLLLALSPFVVSVVTAGVKKVKATNSFSTTGRKYVLRFVVALLAYGSVVGGSILSGQEVDAVATSTFVDSIMVFLSSTGLYFFAKSKKKVE